MSLCWSDDIINYEDVPTIEGWEESHYREIKVPIISKDVWITREGKQMEIKDMASSHLLSTIHFIERNRLMQGLEIYQQRQADNQNWQDAMAYYTQWPIQYEALIAEAQRRGLLFRNVEGLVKKRT